MPSDREVGEFLEEHLQFSWIPNSYAALCEDWLWTGRIIEAMRERGFGLHGSDATQTMEPYWAFHARRHGECEVNDPLSPRTVALAAARALGMEVSE